MPQYVHTQFEAKLASMLKEASAGGESRKRITARELHKRVVQSRDNRMPMACAAMRKLNSHQGNNATVIYEPPSGQGSRLEIEFDTADLPG